MYVYSSPVSCLCLVSVSLSGIRTQWTFASVVIFICPACTCASDWVSCCFRCAAAVWALWPHEYKLYGTQATHAYPLPRETISVSLLFLHLQDHRWVLHCSDKIFQSDQNPYIAFCDHFTPSVLGCIFIFILLIICQFYTVSETHVRIEIVQTLAINFLTSIDPSKCQ